MHGLKFIVSCQKLGQVKVSIWGLLMVSIFIFWSFFYFWKKSYSFPCSKVVWKRSYDYLSYTGGISSRNGDDHISNIYPLWILCGAGNVKDPVFGFGSGKRGQLGISTDKVKSTSLPQITMGLENLKIIRINANGDHSSALSGKFCDAPLARLHIGGVRVMTLSTRVIWIYCCRRHLWIRWWKLIHMGKRVRLCFRHVHSLPLWCSFSYQHGRSRVESCPAIDKYIWKTKNSYQICRSVRISNWKSDVCTGEGDVFMLGGDRHGALSDSDPQKTPSTTDIRNTQNS